MAQKKVNDVNVSSKEVPFGTYSTSSSAQRGSTSSVKKYLDPLEDLNERLSVWDPNLPDFSAIFGRFDDPQVPKMLDRFDEDNEENSPYEEVRVVVRNYDEDIPCSTVRAWVLGIVLVFVGASVNTVFSLRKPAISLSTLIAQLVSYVLGTLWAKTMPTRVFTTFGRKWTLNPGPFNVKEHTLIVVMVRNEACRWIALTILGKRFLRRRLCYRHHPSPSGILQARLWNTLPATAHDLNTKRRLWHCRLAEEISGLPGLHDLANRSPRCDINVFAPRENAS